MKDAGTLRPEHVSLGKMGNVRGASRSAARARTILGANGITLEYPVIRHMNNLESVLTYEGTHEMHTLVVGQRADRRERLPLAMASPRPQAGSDGPGSRRRVAARRHPRRPAQARPARQPGGMGG